MADHAPQLLEAVNSIPPRHRGIFGWPRKIQVGVAAIIIGGLLVGGLGLVFKDSAAYGVLLQRTQGPCTGDRDLINRYNGTVHQYGVASLGDIRKQVIGKSRYQTDATCMYMLTMAAYGQNDTVSMQKNYEALQKLLDTGKKPSDNIKDGIDQQATYDLIVRIINESKQHYYGQG